MYICEFQVNVSQAWHIKIILQKLQTPRLYLQPICPVVNQAVPESIREKKGSRTTSINVVNQTNCFYFVHRISPYKQFNLLQLSQQHKTPVLCHNRMCRRSYATCRLHRAYPYNLECRHHNNRLKLSVSLLVQLCRMSVVNSELFFPVNPCRTLKTNSRHKQPLRSVLPVSLKAKKGKKMFVCPFMKKIMMFGQLIKYKNLK